MRRVSSGSRCAGFLKGLQSHSNGLACCDPPARVYFGPILCLVKGVKIILSLHCSFSNARRPKKLFRIAGSPEKISQVARIKLLTVTRRLCEPIDHHHKFLAIE